MASKNLPIKIFKKRDTIDDRRTEGGGKLRFRELCREAGISPRVLSKELKEMEMNGLVTRTQLDTRPISVEYELTPYSDTLSEVIIAMHAWGKQHRERLIG